MAKMLKNGFPAKPDLADRFGLWFSTGRDIDGLWVGAIKDAAETVVGKTVLHRVEGALQLMKQQRPLHYSRVIRNLDRIWINLLPDSDASYSSGLNACQIDERFVLREETTIERIASVIVHETTHARLERWGITYDEEKRHRIEAICLRRELNFVSGLPGCESLAEQVRQSLDYYSNNPEYFSNRNLLESLDDGHRRNLRHLGVPHWLIAVFARIVKLRRRWGSWKAAFARWR